MSTDAGTKLRKLCLFGLAALMPLLEAAAASSGPPVPPLEPKPRNLLLVVVDTLRFDAGNLETRDPRQAVPAPLRARGRHFLNAIAGGNWTLPSMMTMMTGRRASESGVLVEGSESDIKVPTLAERLRSAGFRTAAVVSNIVVSAPASHLDRGFDNFDDRATTRELNRNYGKRNATETTDAAIQELAALSKQNGPWFLWVHYLEPHGPYAPPVKYLNLPASGGRPLVVARSDAAPHGQLPRYQRIPSCRGRNDYLARYQANARYALEEAGRLLSRGYDSGALENAVVVFTSDHGEFLGEEDYWFQHGQRIDPALVHVPLVIAAEPSETASDERRFVGNIDLVATLLPLLTGHAAPDTEGEDLFRLPEKRRFPLLTEMINVHRRMEVGAVLGESIIVRSTAEPDTEFRWNGDVWETAAPDRELLLRAEAAIRPDMETIRASVPKARNFSSEELRRLRALGYLSSEP